MGLEKERRLQREGKGKLDPHDLAVLEKKGASLLRKISCEPVPVNAAEHYARIKVDYQSRLRDRQRRKQAGKEDGAPRDEGGKAHKPKGLDENDFWIAATCLAWGVRLVTRDKGFEHIENLMVDDWTV